MPTICRRSRVRMGTVRFAGSRCSGLDAENDEAARRERPRCDRQVTRNNQAIRNAVPFSLRRYAMKPRPPKPRIIMAQVEGSGTAPTLLPIPGLNDSV